MAGYGMGGYVGNTHDKARVTRQEKEREEAKQKFEEAKRKAEEGAGLRKFGAGTTEVSSWQDWSQGWGNAWRRACSHPGAPLVMVLPTHMPLPLRLAQTLETAFKNETVGLFTRQEFVEKRATIGDRLQEEKKRQRAADEEAEWQVWCVGTGGVFAVHGVEPLRAPSGFCVGNG